MKTELINQEIVLYKPGDTNIYTFVVKNNKGIEICMYGREPIKKYLDQGYKKMLFDEALPLIEKAENETYITKWDEIHYDKWMEMLEVLPPEKWMRIGHFSIFRMMEYTTGNITAHYIRDTRNNRCFEASRRTTDNYKIMIDEVIIQFKLEKNNNLKIERVM